MVESEIEGSLIGSLSKDRDRGGVFQYRFTFYGPGEIFKIKWVHFQKVEVRFSWSKYIFSRFRCQFSLSQSHFLIFRGYFL